MVREAVKTAEERSELGTYLACNGKGTDQKKGRLQFRSRQAGRMKAGVPCMDRLRQAQRRGRETQRGQAATGASSAVEGRGREMAEGDDGESAELVAVVVVVVVGERSRESMCATVRDECRGGQSAVVVEVTARDPQGQSFSQ